MKKITLLTILLGFYTFTIGQEVSVAKSTGGIQTGFLGLWIYNEFKLSNQIAFRGEFGVSGRIWSNKVVTATQSGYYIAPVLTIEPRWYYDLKNRKSKSKDVNWNSGNFISINIRYHPNWFIITNYDNPNIVNQLAIIPSWGIKRNLGKHFNYEIGTGIGYQYYFSKGEGSLKNENGPTFNFHIRIGYRF